VPYQYATRRLVTRGEPMVEVNVGAPIGYALLAEAVHDRIVAEAHSAPGYLRAVMQAAQVTSTRPFDGEEG